MDGDVLGVKVALLCGGWSDERDVSLSSGEECATALSDAGFSDITLLDVASPSFVTTLERSDFDVAFVALHGRYGEDGCVQGLLELLDIPYTFSGVLASALASDKAMTKDVYRAHGLMTPDSFVLTSPDSSEAVERTRTLGMPVFVKPVADGSSFGVTRVDDVDRLSKALETAFSCGGRVLVERAVEGTEVTVPVLGNARPRALPPIEIRVASGFYDLEAKYDDPVRHHVIPPRLSDEMIAKVQGIACEAHRALGCSGASRSDLIISSDDVPYLLETNVIPGMTSASLLPDSARHAGIEFPELCRLLVELAFERAEEVRGGRGVPTSEPERP